MARLALLINLGGCLAAFYLGYSSYPWYLVLALGALSAAVSVERQDPRQPLSLTEWAFGWLMAALMIALLFLALYFVGVWVR